MRPANTYRCTIEPKGAAPIVWLETVGRRAIIDTRKLTHASGLGAKGTVRIQQRGSVRWKILYQCVVQKDGRLSRRGIEL